jgi:hypothetical protein
MKNHKNGINKLSTFDLIKKPFTKNNNYKKKEKLSGNGGPPPPPSGQVINHIAVVLDEEVQEVIRAENRLAALLLSQPEFIEFDPESENKPRLGSTYKDGIFINPEEING